MDQEPFGIVFDKGVPSESGVFIRHGHWDDRTRHGLPAEFWQHGKESGIGGYYPPPSLPAGSYGPLDELRMTGNVGAFAKILGSMIEFL